jgi:hypothetical protein
MPKKYSVVIWKRKHVVPVFEQVKERLEGICLEVLACCKLAKSGREDPWVHNNALWCREDTS